MFSGKKKTEDKPIQQPNWVVPRLKRRDVKDKREGAATDSIFLCVRGEEKKFPRKARDPFWG